VRHYGEIANPGLQLAPGERSQDHAKLSFFSQDKSSLFYRFPRPLSSEKVCKRQVIHGSQTGSFFSGVSPFSSFGFAICHGQGKLLEVSPALTQGQEFPYSGIDLSGVLQSAWSMEHRVEIFKFEFRI
jgi:hypothetical protein